MSHLPSQFSLQEIARATIEVAPVEEEEDDLTTLAALGSMYAELQHAIAQLEGYTMETQTRGEPGQQARGVDPILLITVLGASIAAYKDLLTSICTVISTTIEVLAKRGHIQEMQIIADGKTFILHDVSKKTAKELIESLEAQHPGATATLTSGKTVQVKAKISQSRKRRTP